MKSILFLPLPASFRNYLQKFSRIYNRNLPEAFQIFQMPISGHDKIGLPFHGTGEVDVIRRIIPDGVNLLISRYHFGQVGKLSDIGPDPLRTAMPIHRRGSENAEKNKI